MKDTFTHNIPQGYNANASAQCMQIPETHVGGVFDHTGAMIPRYRSVVDSTTGRTIAVNPDTYAHVDPIALMREFDDVVKSGRANWSSGGSLYGDRKFFASLTVGKRELGNGHGVEGKLTLFGSHDRSTRVGMRPSTHNIVCRNTYAAFLADRSEGGYETTHKGDAHARMLDAASTLALACKAFDNLTEKLESLRTRRVTFAQFKAIVQSVYRVKMHRKSVEEGVSPLLSDILAGGLSTGSGVINEVMFATEQDRKNRTVDLLAELYETAPASDPGNAYGVLQAITYYDQHRAGRGKNAEENRVNSTWIDPEDRVSQLETLLVRVGA